MYFLELWYGSVALHGEGLPGAGLSVGEDCPVVTLGKLLYNKHTDRPTQRVETVRLQPREINYVNDDNIAIRLSGCSRRK